MPSISHCAVTMRRNGVLYCSRNGAAGTGSDRRTAEIRFSAKKESFFFLFCAFGSYCDADMLLVIEYSEQ